MQFNHSSNCKGVKMAAKQPVLKKFASDVLQPGQMVDLDTFIVDKQINHSKCENW